MSKENKQKKKLFKRRPREKKLNRSMAGNTLLFVIMFICGVFMALPLVMIINNALKPLDEIYQFPPKIFVRNPTLENFSDLFVLMNSSWVPFSRYILNTIIITGGGMVGHVLCASLAAYPLAKHNFPGKKILFNMVVLSMMFSWTVTQIPQYLIISWLHINNTYAALILPACSFGMGLYLMKQFMEENVKDVIIEAAKIDGAASLSHMMNANTFTCGAFHAADAKDVSTLASDLRSAIQGKQWMCGFPEKLVIVTMDQYVISMYGNEDLINTFRDKLLASYSNASVVYDEGIG